MRKFLFASVLMFLPLAASASPISVIGTYSVQYTPAVGNSPQIQKIFSDPFTLNLTPGVPTSVTTFLAVTPAGSCGSCGRGNSASGTVSVSFNFSAPGAGTASDTAAYLANYYNDTDSVIWNAPDPMVVNFGDGAILDVDVVNASDWTIYPGIYFDLIKGPSAVPEAPSVALLGAGLFCLTFVLVRRRRKVVRPA